MILAPPYTCLPIYEPLVGFGALLADYELGVSGLNP